MQRTLTLLCIFVLALGGAGAFAAAQGAGSDAGVAAPVASDRGNPSLSGEHPGPGPDGKPVELWRYEGEVVMSTPVAADGSVYLFDWDRSSVIAFDPATGAERWRYQQIDFTMEVEAADGEMVYVSGNQGSAAGIPSFAAALDATTGEEAWRFEDPSRWIVDLAVGEGAAFVLVGGYPLATLVAFDAAGGAERWRVDLPGGATKPALVDGTLYLLTYDGLLALSVEDGSERWRYERDGRGGFPTVGDSLVLIGAAGTLVALDRATGLEAWTYAPEEPGHELTGRPAIAGDTVYVLTGVREPEPEDTVRALDAASGEERWAFAAGEELGPPAVAGDAVYVGTAGAEDGRGDLLALDALSGAERWHFAGAGAMDTFPVVVDGTVFVVGEGEGFDLYLYAIGGSESAAGSVATPTGDEQPEATPASGIAGDTYTDPTYGWTIAWDPAVWHPIDSPSGDLFLSSENGRSQVIFNGTERYGGDLAACVAAIGSRQGYQVLTDAAGQLVAGEDATRAYAAFDAGMGEIYAIDCRALGGEAVLEISHFTDMVDYPAEAAAVEALLSALEIPDAA